MSKWIKAKPGTVIPAGQPHRIKYIETWDETVPKDATAIYYVDSTWTPSPDLPTEPTWGIAVLATSKPEMGKWSLLGGDLFEDKTDGLAYGVSNVLDFVPLTPEQVARIEAAR